MKLISSTKSSTVRPHRPPPQRIPTGKRAGASLFVALLVAALPGGGPLAKSKETAASQGDVAERKSDLQQLRGQIDTLRKGVAAAENKRSDAADQLKELEQEISGTQRDLHSLGAQRDKLQSALKDLANQSRELQNRLAGQQTQLERLVYRQYLQGKPDSLRLLLNGDDSNQMARDLHYLAIIGGARRQLLDEAAHTLQRKMALAADTRQRADELAAVEARHQQQHVKLLAQRQQRQAVLQKISANIADQRRQIGNLQRDEKQLTQVIERLSKRIAEQAARAAKAEQEARAARAAQARKAAPKSPAAGESAAPSRPAPQLNNEKLPEAMPAGDFARHKGSLRLPVRGQVSNRFGAPRQEGSTWKGLFIRAAAGGEVKAIAAGRVVFADWMRGFGNIVIVDHGGSYLSIYGNNEALIKQTGDSVNGGDLIASVGNSGGNPESGLYFELRHQGRPLDPLKWINLR